jgi:hypothetical protein
MSPYGPKADIAVSGAHVAFGGGADLGRAVPKFS